MASVMGFSVWHVLWDLVWDLMCVASVVGFGVRFIVWHLLWDSVWDLLCGIRIPHANTHSRSPFCFLTHTCKSAFFVWSFFFVVWDIGTCEFVNMYNTYIYMYSYI